MRLFRRTPRPRLLGESRPAYSAGAMNCFAKLGGAAALATHGYSEEATAEALEDMGREFTVSRLYANDTLLSRIAHYCLTVQDYTRGAADREEVGWAREEFFAACREALGTDTW